MIEKRASVKDVNEQKLKMNMLARIQTPLPQAVMYFQLIQLLIHDIHSLRKTPPTE